MIRRLAAILAFTAVAYAALLAIWMRFPYVQSDVSLIAPQKHQIARVGRPFASNATLKVMAFGNSRMLDGFIPSTFDSLFAAQGMAGVQSYNFGLPADLRFLDDLEVLLARGEGPDIILLADASWAEERPWWSFLDPELDQDRIALAVPFRRLPRDFAVAVVQSGASAALFTQQYRERRDRLVAMARARGVFGGSCPGCRARALHAVGAQHLASADSGLPPDFSVLSDSAGKVASRASPGGPDLRRLARLLTEHGVVCLFVPPYYREGQFAPPNADDAAFARSIVHNPSFGVVGPSYVLLPPALFFDVSHVNREGAEVYTQMVARLTRDWVSRHGRPHGSTP